MDQEKPEKQSGLSTRGALWVGVGVVLILALAFFLASFVGAMVHVHNVLRDGTENWGGIWTDENVEIAVKRLGGPERAAGQLSFYLRLPERVTTYRRQAVTLLGFCGKSAVPALKRALKNEDTFVRSHAVYALGRIGPAAKGAVCSLKEALEGESDMVAIGAARVLFKMGAPDIDKTVSILMRMLEDKKGSERKSAAITLGEMGTAAKNAVPILAQAVEDEDVEVRIYAARALWQVAADKDKALPVLLRELTDGEAKVRRIAAKALGVFGASAEAAIPALEQALNGGREDVRAAAAEALKKIRGGE